MQNRRDNRAPEGAERKDRLRQASVRLLTVIALSIFVAEALVYIVLYLFPQIPGSLVTLMDAGLLLVFLSPVLHRFIIGPMESLIVKKEAAEASLIEYKANLETLIEERTARATAAVKELEREMAERARTEEALLKSEERFRQLFQQTEDAIILFKPGSCRIIDINPVAERLYGYTKQELFELGPSCFVKQEDHAWFCETITGVCNGGSLRIDSTNHRHKDGREIIVSVRGKMVTIQGVDLVYCTMRDITTRIRLEKEARLIQAKLIHTNKMTSLGVLVAGIAHEINNPNNFILINAEILTKSWEDIAPILREYYDDHGDFMVGGVPYSQMSEHLPDVFTGIRDGSQRIKEIVNNLKDFARDGKTTPDGMVDVNRSVSASVSILSHQVKKRTRNFRLELAEYLPPVRGSAQQLEQVIMNLILNALQSLPSEDRGVSVITAYDNVADQVVVSVKDEGKGIPREIADRILEPFFTTRLDSGGSGLGLAISYSIIKEHRGTLEFESPAPGGATFTVRLPVAHHFDQERFHHGH